MLKKLGFLVQEERSSGGCAARNFVLLVTLGGTHVCLIVYLTMHQMKQIMER